MLLRLPRNWLHVLSYHLPSVHCTHTRASARPLGGMALRGLTTVQIQFQTGRDITGNFTSQTCCSWLGCEICFPRQIKSSVDGCLCTQLSLLAFIFLPERGVNIQLVSTAGVPLRSGEEYHWEQTRPLITVSTGYEGSQEGTKWRTVAAAVPEFLDRKVFGEAAIWLEGCWRT